MNRLRALIRTARSVLTRHRLERDLDAELAFHLDRAIEQNLGRGMTPQEARRTALALFGQRDAVRDECRQAWGVRLLDVLRRDVRYSARMLRRSPAFTIPTVLTMALAIGASVSVFAVVERVLLNPLPYPDSDRLIELDHGALGLDIPSGMGLTLGLYYHYSERSRTLESVAMYRTEELTLTGTGDPERIRVAHTTPSLAPVLRVWPERGRWFAEEEGAPGGPPVAVLSHGLWLRRYGGDPAILGRSVILDGVAKEVIGVMPASYAFPDPRVDVWIPAQLARSMGFGIWDYDGVARLRGRATVADLQAEQEALIAEVPQAYPGDLLAAGNTASIELIPTPRTLKEAVIGGVAHSLWILLASVGVVWLVACANVANLFLVHTDARQREVAIRRALGAGGAGIARGFLLESTLASMLSGIIGVALAWTALRLLVGIGPANLPRLEEIRLDGVTIAFSLVLTLLAAVTFGAIPLLRGAPLAATLRDSGRSNTASRSRHRTRHLLMAAQVALALVLLVSSGLMARSFQRLRAVDPGFDAQSSLTFSIGLPAREYSSRDAAVAAHQAIVDSLSVRPGVTAVSASTCLPLAGACWGNTVRVEGRSYAPGTVPPVALFRAVAGGYFEVMGIRLFRGRGIDRSDVERREPIVVVDETFANRFFPNQDPIGQRVASNRPPARPGERDLTWLTIVGIVGNTPRATLGEADPVPHLYMPISIAGEPGLPTQALVGPDISVMSYVVRSATPPLGLLPAVRRAIDTVDRNLALAQVGTLQDALDRASAQMAFTMVLIALAAASALMLGVIGIYGAMSYIVSQRTSEIGIRLALGAEPGSVSRMIVRQGGIVALGGIAAGLATAAVGGRLIESLLFNVSPRDPAVFAATALALLSIVLVACWLPARRAARLNPMQALREE